MTRIFAIAAAITLLCTTARAQTPAELDAYYQAKATADALNQVVVRANAAAIEQIRVGLALDSARLTAIEGKVDAALATLKQLQAQPGVTTQQVIDALVAKLTAP